MKTGDILQIPIRQLSSSTSDGTSTLHFLDPYIFEEIGRIEVRDKDGHMIRLNELEYVQRVIYAGVWEYDSPGDCPEIW